MLELGSALEIQGIHNSLISLTSHATRKPYLCAEQYTKIVQESQHGNMCLRTCVQLRLRSACTSAKAMIMLCAGFI